MAVKTTTTYACDGCGKTTKKPGDWPTKEAEKLAGIVRG